MDILDASNLKKGTVAFKKDRFDLRAAVQTCVQDLSGSAAGKDLSIEFDPLPGDYMIAGDEEKLKQHVLRNLIDNAIRYTLKGSIHVSLSRDSDRIVFSVKDSGVGITPEDMARLFTEGGHGKDSIKINVHSTGYGLFIAKQVVEAHGGTISAHSDGAGTGSTFIVELTAV
jgi:signal transduction histidine kinase